MNNSNVRVRGPIKWVSQWSNVGGDHTIVFRKNQTLTTKALCKLGHFEPRLSTLKVMSWLWVSISNRYVLDLPNKILNIDIGQGAAKISEVKVGGRKKISVDSVRFENNTAVSR